MTCPSERKTSVPEAVHERAPGRSPEDQYRADAVVLCVTDANPLIAQVRDLHAVAVEGTPRAFAPCGLRMPGRFMVCPVIPGSLCGTSATNVHLFPYTAARTVGQNFAQAAGADAAQNQERPCADRRHGAGTAITLHTGLSGAAAFH